MPTSNNALTNMLVNRPYVEAYSNIAAEILAVAVKIANISMVANQQIYNEHFANAYQSFEKSGEETAAKFQSAFFTAESSGITEFQNLMRNAAINWQKKMAGYMQSQSVK
jgi:hypothetical protein